MGAYGRAISKSASSLSLDVLKLSPHGLRHSGPSTDSHHRIRDIAAIQQRGRWAAPSSVARYRKPGRMLLLHQHVPADIWRQSDKCFRELISFFSGKRKNV